MQQQPLVSIGIPTYNRPESLKRTIASIAGQTYRNLEMIISDNGSPGQAVDNAVLEFSKKDRRIIYCKQSQNKGAYLNFRFVLEKASGEYFMWAADDDWWEPTFIAKALKVMESDPSIAACWPDLVFHDEEDRIVRLLPQERYMNPDLSGLGKADAALRWHFQIGWYGIYSLFRTSVIRAIMGRHLDGDGPAWGFDAILITEILLQGRVVKIPEPLFHYSRRKIDCDRFHLENNPSYRPLSHAHPYLDQLQTMQACIWKSTDLPLIAKVLYFSKFNLRILRGDDIWRQKISRYAQWPYLKKLLLEFRIARVLHLAWLGSWIWLASSMRLKPLRRLAARTRNAFRKVAENVRFQSFSKPAPLGTVLIIEPNNFHGETIPGLIRYFELLGRPVCVACSDEIFRENPFCRFRPKGSKIHHFSYDKLCAILHSDKIGEFTLCFLNSSYDYRARNFFHDTLDQRAGAANNLLVLEHNLPNMEKYLRRELIAQRRIVALRTGVGSPAEVTMINPHYFGIVKGPQIKNTSKTIFVMVGFNYRSQSYLLQVLERLAENRAKNIEIILIGNETEHLILGKKCAPYVKKRGRLPYNKMFKELERAHFILFLLEKDNPLQRDYLTGKTSGMRQLSLGFLKPAIIQRDFGRAFGFNEDNSIMYERDEGLADALVRAAAMTPESYIKMHIHLGKLANDVHHQSLKNLKKIISSR